MKTSKTFLGRHKKMLERDKVYGTTTIGTRGQVVIPAKARHDLQLKPGDRLIVLGKFGKALGRMKTEELAEFAAMIMDHVAGSPVESLVKKQINKLFGKLKKQKGSL